MAHSGLERATVFQKAEVGIESVEGTLQTALTRFAKSSIELEPHINFTRLSTIGLRFDTDSIPGIKWTSYTVKGNPCYDEIAWFLDSFANTAAASTPGGGTNSRERTHTQSADHENTYSTMTIKQGDKRTRAQRALGCYLAGLGITWDLEKIEQSHDGLGRKFEDGIQLSTNEQQSLIKTGTVSGGTFTLTLVNPETGVSATTAAIAYNAVYTAIQSAIDLLANVSSGEVVVSGGPAPSSATVFEFRGRFGQINVAAMTVDNTLITGGGTMTLTTTVPGVAPTPTSGIVMRAQHIKVYIDTTSGGLGTTLLDRCYGGQFELRNVRSAHFTVNADNAGSSIGAIPNHIAGKFVVSLQADANNMAIYYAAADGANPTFFARIDIGGSAGGLLIEGSLYYQWTIDCAIKISNVTPFKDVAGGIYAFDLEAAIVYDPTWNKAWTSLLRNAVATVA